MEEIPRKESIRTAEQERDGRDDLLMLEYRIVPGTTGRSYPISGISYEKIVQKKDPGNGTQSARNARGIVWE
jgi:hypothetical protein